MAASKLSAEWNHVQSPAPASGSSNGAIKATLTNAQYVSTAGLPLLPKSLTEARTARYERGLVGQSLLSKPQLAVLAEKVQVENTTVELPEVPMHKFPIRVYRPAAKTSGTLPVFLYFHGGFWCNGDANSEDLGCRAVIARGADIIVVSFEYRLIPEHKWSQVFSDAEYAMKWLSQKAASLGGDPAKGFIIGGAQAGAQLAAICAIRARNRYPNITLTGQVLIVPTTLAWPDPKIPQEWTSRLTSHITMADAPVLNEETYEMFVGALGMTDEEKRDPENFPVWDSLKNLPPAYLPMDECDPLCDQGFLLAEMLADAGVKTRTDLYRGLPNMFVHFPELPTTATAGIHLSAGVRWLLQERK